MKKTRQQIIDDISEVFGKEPSNEQLAILEDLSDSFPDESENWQAKYEQNDKEWRTRYAERFKSGGTPPPDPDPDPDPEPEYLTFEDLFKGE